ncbi:hypothetical protein CI105_06340 [Candidatus Izimaplasma bacterium ZiA1]|uniref:PAS domain S-box protein n=1 Tax=Candidatus Izimoplasma sp. ZiA1 TaxID=2024899 RepID=UPI000BAA69EB|nr:hypothetical protein CI105_06340 [Candidatus Izimaplasma bacterium ZiA1]
MEERMYKNYDSFTGIVCFFDNQDVITYSNDFFAKMLGYNKFEMVGLKITDLIVPDEKASFFDMVYLDNITHNITVKFYHKTGAFRFFSIRIYNLDNQKQILGHLIKRKYSGFDFESIKDLLVDDQLLQKIESDNLEDFIKHDSIQLKLVLDSLPIDVWIKDKYYRYIFMNNSLRAHTGIKSDEYYLKTDFDLYEKDVANEFVTSDQSAVDAKRKIYFTFESKTTRLVQWTEVAKIPLFNKHSKHLGLIGCAIDISEQKRIEVQLADEKRRLENIVENIHGMVIELNQDGTIIYQAGPLIKDYNMINNNIYEYFTKIEKNSELIEKVKLAFSGFETSLVTTIHGVKFEIKFKQVISEQDQVTVIGFGNEINE